MKTDAFIDTTGGTSSTSGGAAPNHPRAGRRLMITLLAGVLLAAGGCSSTGGNRSNTASADSDALYNGMAPITFDSMFTGEDTDDFETLGDRARREGEEDKAIYAYLRATQTGGDKARLFAKIGDLHQARGNARLSLLAYNRALQTDPDWVPALQGAGLVYLRQRHYEEAQGHLERAVALDQQRLGGEQAERASSADMPSAARGEAKGEASEALPPHDARSPYQAYRGLGVLADLAGEHEQAIRYYQISGAIRPHSAITHNNLGYSHYMAGDLDSAKRHFRRAILIEPSFKRGWCNLALIHQRQGRQEDALSALEQVLTKSEAYNTLGYLNMLAGNHTQAEQFLQQAIALSPSYYEEAQQNLERNRSRGGR